MSVLAPGLNQLQTIAVYQPTEQFAIQEADFCSILIVLFGKNILNVKLQT